MSQRSIHRFAKAGFHRCHIQLAPNKGLVSEEPRPSFSPYPRALPWAAIRQLHDQCLAPAPLRPIRRLIGEFPETFRSRTSNIINLSATLEMVHSIA